MPREVIMPALGMAQTTGLIVAWHKRAGEAVAEGDTLFEVETDKATMEVEAQAAGYLTDVGAEAGADVPVGQVIARISESPDSTAPAPEAQAEAAAGAAAPSEESLDSALPDDALPEGKPVIMPTLGMAQQTGLLVGWHKAPGDAVTADDILFDVETDKSTVEVSAGTDGYVAALLAEAGDEVPVGQTIAIISAAVPANPISRGAAGKAAPRPKAPEAAPPAGVTKAAKAAPKPAPTATLPATAGASQAPPARGRILASPLARRLAREKGLDLARLVQAGHRQPFHAKDLQALRALPAADAASSPAALPPCRLTAELSEDGFGAFAAWAAETASLIDPAALLAGLCAGSLGRPAVIAVETIAGSQTFAAEARLGATVPSDDAPALRLRDLRDSPVSTVQIGAAGTPALTLTRQGEGLTVTLEYAPGQLEPGEAIALLSQFAGRMEQPLRHLL